MVIYEGITASIHRLGAERQEGIKRPFFKQSAGSQLWTLMPPTTLSRQQRSCTRQHQVPARATLIGWYLHLHSVYPDPAPWACRISLDTQGGGRGRLSPPFTLPLESHSLCTGDADNTGNNSGTRFYTKLRAARTRGSEDGSTHEGVSSGVAWQCDPDRGARPTALPCISYPLWWFE